MTTSVTLFLRKNFDSLGELAICNKKLSQGISLSQLKNAKSTPVFEKGGKNEIYNYRPFSVLSFTIKIIEKTVVSQLSKYLLDNNLQTSRRFGYRSGISTENAIHNVLQDI